MILLLLGVVFGVVRAQNLFQTQSCTSPLTGANDVCTTFGEYDNALAVKTPCLGAYSTCFCPHDTCNPGACQDYYYYSHNPDSLCHMSCQTTYQCQAFMNCNPWRCDWTGCPTFTGHSVVGPDEWFCTTAVRASFCNGNGDYGTPNTPLTSSDPFKSSFTCQCDCGYTGSCAGPMSITTATCINPYSRTAVAMSAVTVPSVSCNDPNVNPVTCWCPSDTCQDDTVTPQVWCLPLSNGSMSTGGQYFNTQRNRGWYFCGSNYRMTICNSHGDSAALIRTTYTAATDGTGQCTCDCGWTGRFCTAQSSSICGSSIPCTNPATSNSVTMQAICSPTNYAAVTFPDGIHSCDTSGHPCWCPSDTCTLVTSGGNPATPYMECNAINGVGYIGLSYFTAARGANVAVFCGQSFRTVVCNGHGDTVLQTGIPWNAFPGNTYSQPQPPCQCDNGWFNTDSSHQCNINVICPSPRAGRAPPGAGTCGFVGWNSPFSQGFCQQNGQCQCVNGWSGTACDNFCPTNDNTQECSGQGNCALLNDAYDYVIEGRWTTTYFPSSEIFPGPNVGILRQAATKIEHRATSALFQRNQYAPFTAIYNLPLRTACFAGQTLNATRGCYRNMMQFFFQGPAGANFTLFKQQRRYNGTNMVQMVTDMFAAYYGFITVDPSWIQPTALPALFASSSVDSQARGLSLFLAYEEFVDFASADFSAPYPNFAGPVWRCDCLGSNTGTAPGGPACTAACPTGATGTGLIEACGGLTQGLPQGQCETQSNTCDCARNFAGPACTVSLAGLCFDSTVLGADVLCSGSSHGTCNVTTVGQTALASCACNPSWEGQFCAVSKCSLNTTECSNHGICTAVNSGFQCVCNDPIGTNVNVRPPVWVGAQCNINAATQCGYFVPNLVGGGGTWTKCFNHAQFTGNQCVLNATSHQYYCNCTKGQTGQFCQITTCNPACNSHQNCNGGTCVCQHMWSGTGCNTNLCGHGHPSVDGSTCVCDPYYRVDSNGHCTITQCPLVYSTPTGVRACNYAQDTNCTNPELGTPQQGCCWDACGQGSTSECIVTNGQPTCNCDTTLYNQTGGICYSRCNGQPVSLVSGHYHCDCSAVSHGTNQWVSSTDCSVHTCQNGAHVAPCGCSCSCTTPPWTGPNCDISDCQNGGTPGINGCNCPVMWGGPTCGTSNCANGGMPINNGTACQCPPKWGGPMCHTNLCLHGGTPNNAGTACNCPTPYTGSFCANNTCQHGGTPSGSGCSCPFPYSGTNCASFQCQHGGTPVNGTCSCPFPYSGATCGGNLCQNGGTPSGSTCSCVPGYTGSVCQTLSSCNHGGVFHSNNHTCSCPPAWGGGTCFVSQCQHGGTPATNGQSCTGCQAAWGGTLCQTSQCQHGGTPKPAGTSCTCPFPYTGTLCAANQCLHGGTPSGSTCQCSVPWQGTTCNTTACQNGGTASSDNTACVCASGFTGEFCQTHIASSSSTGTSSQSTSSSTTLSTGAIAGIAVGGAVAVTGIVLGIYFGVTRSAVAAAETAGLITRV